MERISVAIATYNGGKYLREQLDSLYTQSRVPDEVFVSDDNSSDGTILILKEYSIKYGLKYSVNAHALGVNKNFEKALISCTGDYIMICDQDDIWLPHKIERSLKYMRELEGKWGSGCPVLITSEACSFISGKPIDLHEKKSIETIDHYRDLLFNSTQYCQGCTMMLNRALLDGLPHFPNNFHNFPYDAHIAMTAILIGKRCHIKQNLMLYRHHSNNVVVNLNRKSSLKNKLYERICPLVYSFYKIPYPRQRYYMELLEKKDLTILDDNVKRDILLVVTFAKSHFIGRVRSILSVSGIAKSNKWAQLLLTTITYPLRLIVPIPKV